MRALPLLLLILSTPLASPGKGKKMVGWPGLQVRVELDHDVYFRGEDPTIKLTVTNTSNRILTIPTPFVPTTGYLSVLTQSRQFPDVFEPQVADAAPRRLARDRAHRTKLRPAETKTAVIRMWDACTVNGLTTECGLFMSPGRHRFCYFYALGVVHAEFAIVQPLAEHWTEIILPGKFSRNDLVGSRAPMGGPAFNQRVWAAVLRHGDTRYLVASMAQLVASQTSAPPFSPVFLDTRTPYRRFAKLDHEVRSLHLERAEQGALLVKYQYVNGQEASLRIPADEVRAWKLK